MSTTQETGRRGRGSRKFRYGVRAVYRSIAAPPEVWEVCDDKATALRVETRRKHDCSNLIAELLIAHSGLREKYLNGRSDKEA